MRIPRDEIAVAACGHPAIWLRRCAAGRRLVATVCNQYLVDHAEIFDLKGREVYHSRPSNARQVRAVFFNAGYWPDSVMNTSHQTIDSLQFCLRNQSLVGEFPCAELPRLAEELAAASGSVRYALQGGRVDGRPSLSLRVDAELVLPCQRCGQGISVPVHSESRVLIARSEEELVAWEAEHILLDALVADARLVVADFVEDEVMLSLPISPRHADGDAGCAAAEMDPSRSFF